MIKYFELKILVIIILILTFGSCTNTSKQESVNIENPALFKNKGHKLVFEMVNKVGNIKKLYDKKNVSYTYTYETPDGKSDISNEKYVFEGELSYGKYIKHERTFPQLKGVIEQSYDGQNFWLKHNGKILSDKDLLKRVAFNRPTNYYWFTMMQKLLDPGIIYEYLGEEKLENKEYNIVKVSFEKKGDKPTDIYQLYINKKSLLVDQFLFTVADFGKMETPNLMQLKYEEIEGILIPTNRQYKLSSWKADVTAAPWIKVNWTDVKFSAEITQADFELKADIKND